MAPSCASDVAPTREEAQLWRLLGDDALVGGDAHPDAHAVRLRLTLATAAAHEDSDGGQSVGRMLAGLEDDDLVGGSGSARRRSESGDALAAALAAASEAKAGAPQSLAPQWDARAELCAYVRKRDHVSAACRLEPAEEAALFAWLAGLSGSESGGGDDGGGGPNRRHGGETSSAPDRTRQLLSINSGCAAS